jgi:hypothetical protein
VWNRAVASKLLGLPRELRDMVYAQIWTEDYQSQEGSLMVARIRRFPDDVALPHVVDKDYVGPEIAREMVEAFYRHAGLTAFTAQGLEDIPYLLSLDVFNVGLDPKTVLRECKVVIDMDDEDWQELQNYQVDVTYVEPVLNKLLDIVVKKGFKLDIELKQRRVRLNLWDDYLDMLRPIIFALESEGAMVGTSWCCVDPMRYEVPCIRSNPKNLASGILVRYELDDVIKQGDNIDKHDTIRLLDAEVGIDREYRVEDDYDYDPSDYLIYEDANAERCGCSDCIYSSS